MLNEKIDQVITEIGDIQDDLTALLDDLWLDINHTDPDSIRTGSERMIAAVSAADTFRKACNEITVKLRGFLPQPQVSTSITEDVESLAVQTAAPTITTTEKDEATDWFGGKQKIGLHDSWTYRRPFGFILRGQPFAWLRTWADLYVKLLKVLHDVNPEIFDTLPNRAELISRHNNPYVARDRHELRLATKLSDSVFVETNLNANLIRDNVRRILRIFDVNETELDVRLRK